MNICICICVFNHIQLCIYIYMYAYVALHKPSMRETLQDAPAPESAEAAPVAAERT